jgi:hypothetical protein
VNIVSLPNPNHYPAVAVIAARVLGAVGSQK